MALMAAEQGPRSGATCEFYRYSGLRVLRFMSRIMFMPDQLRYDSLGCTGNPVVQTPFFDKLAAEGTLFTSMHSSPSDHRTLG